MKNKYKGLKKAWLIKMTEEDILYNLEDNPNLRAEFYSYVIGKLNENNDVFTDMLSKYEIEYTYCNSINDLLNKIKTSYVDQDEIVAINTEFFPTYEGETKRNIKKRLKKTNLPFTFI